MHAETTSQGDAELTVQAASPQPRRPSDNHSESQRRGSFLQPDDEIQPVLNETPAGKKPVAKMRSSIACSRCRRSKIKCMNNGTNTTCRACATTGRECVYPPPAVGQTVAKRAEPTGVSRNEGESDAKRQKKRENESGRKHSVRVSDDPFESPQITPKLWKEVYNAFMLHCSAELPFIHEEVFHLRVQQSASERSPDTQIFLLAMLALTARFIPDLALAYNAADPLVASEYYADAVSARLDAPALSREPTLERVQALVMISLYHWGMCRGQSAWMYLTIAKGYDTKSMFDVKTIC